GGRGAGRGNPATDAGSWAHAGPRRARQPPPPTGPRLARDGRSRSSSPRPLCRSSRRLRAPLPPGARRPACAGRRSAPGARNGRPRSARGTFGWGSWGGIIEREAGARLGRRTNGHKVSPPIFSSPMIDALKDKLQAEVERLNHEINFVLPKEIDKARAHGDLRENSEYKAALERQQFVASRLTHLRMRLGTLSSVPEA